MRRILITLVLLLVCRSAFSQLNFQFVPEIHGRNIEGLLNAKISNAVARRAVSLTVTVSERTKGRVLSLKTAAFNLPVGTNTIPVNAVRSAKIQFASSGIANRMRQSGLLPEGDYEFCYTLTPEQGYYDPEVPLEQCFDAELTPFAPLTLVEPYNQDKVCETRPLFSWQPSFPHVQGGTYQLLLVELRGDQKGPEALNYNLPLISQSNMINPVMPYPASFRELQPGKRYAWQVSIYKNQTVLNRSEVWEFTVDCRDTVTDTKLNYDGFRDIEDLAQGNFYVADGYLQFGLTNSYGEQNLKYEIDCISDPELKVKSLPALKLERGKNRIVIDLRSKRAFKHDYYYILKVWLPNGSVKSLRFVFKDKL
ncbi:DUF928 domain-containing protein [Pedobacter sp. SYSU D00535]|uniref:DUF928 domain-containing protein n=1 Tax=Pedobacter sp. SYSU D00535 TaxID=2810308 RepID=UPI001A95D0EC|nr:DUF928 domain-containing protein [Pedobacter sp. SYSU D00535]